MANSFVHALLKLLIIFRLWNKGALICVKTETQRRLIDDQKAVVPDARRTLFAGEKVRIMPQSPARLRPCEVLGFSGANRPATVVALLTDHLAAAAVDIMAEYAPYWEPTTLRNAAQLMRFGARHLENLQSGNEKPSPRVVRASAP